MNDFLKITTRRLPSGRFQVHFATRGLDRNFYGYLLTDSRTPVSEVLEKIERHVHRAQHGASYFHRNLYALGKRPTHHEPIMMFKTPSPQEL